MVLPFVFLKCCKIPNEIPIGTEINVEYKLIKTVGGSFSTKRSKPLYFDIQQDLHQFPNHHV